LSGLRENTLISEFSGSNYILVFASLCLAILQKFETKDLAREKASLNLPQVEDNQGKWVHTKPVHTVSYRFGQALT
jgi:hypothetical protein